MKCVSKTELAWELTRHRYAHRGLHRKPTVPENSMEAFRLAVEEGFGIELDLHLTRDGQVAVIHDASLKRTAGVDLLIEDLTLAEAQQYVLEESRERIPDFRDVLQLVDGKVPLLVELKAERGNHEALTHAVMGLLEGYEGMYCIESFNPGVVKTLKERYPDVVRGQLAGALNREEKVLTAWQDFLLKNLLVNFTGKPDFVSYRYSDRDIKAFRNFKGPRFMWTIKTCDELKICEAWGAAPIFEQFDPKNCDK